MPRTNWKRRSGYAGLAVFLLGLVALPIIGLIGLNNALAGLHFDFDPDFGDIHLGRDRLRPIPVAKTACPSLVPVREQGEALSDLWSRAFDGSIPWSTFRPELELRMIALQQSAHAAAPYVPAPIATRFRKMEWDIAVGRNDLPHARSVEDLLYSQQFPVIQGLVALAESSDLVGPACGQPLYSGMFS